MSVQWLLEVAHADLCRLYLWKLVPKKEETDIFFGKPCNWNMLLLYTIFFIMIFPVLFISQDIATRTASTQTRPLASARMHLCWKCFCIDRVMAGYFLSNDIFQNILTREHAILLWCTQFQCSSIRQLGILNTSLQTCHAQQYSTKAKRSLTKL